MKTFIVTFSVNGRGRNAVTVQATNAMTARDIARGQIEGEYGYADAKITITSVREVK